MYNCICTYILNDCIILFYFFYNLSKSTEKLQHKNRVENDYYLSLKRMVVSYLGLDAITPPVNFLYCVRLKFVPVSNMALISGEGPPSIRLPHWMQFRSEQLN